MLQWNFFPRSKAHLFRQRMVSSSQRPPLFQNLHRLSGDSPPCGVLLKNTYHTAQKQNLLLSPLSHPGTRLKKLRVPKISSLFGRCSMNPNANHSLTMSEQPSASGKDTQTWRASSASPNAGSNISAQPWTRQGILNSWQITWLMHLISWKKIMPQDQMQPGWIGWARRAYLCWSARQKSYCTD